MLENFASTLQSSEVNQERQPGFALWAPWDLFWGSRKSFLFHRCPTPIFLSQQSISCCTSIASSQCIRKHMGNRSLLEEEWNSPQFVIILPAKANTLPLPKCSWELSLGQSAFLFSSSSPGTKSCQQAHFRGRVCLTVRVKKMHQKCKATNFEHFFELLIFHYLFFTLNILPGWSIPWTIN